MWKFCRLVFTVAAVSIIWDKFMPRGDKSSYSNKQKRQAEHIEEGYKDKGVSTKEAERRAWATVNKETGGGKKGGKASAGKSKTSAKKSSPAKKRTGAKPGPKKSSKKSK